MTEQQLQLYRDMARAYRDRSGLSEGVVIIYGGEIQGWSCELTEPRYWVPGCVAVKESGTCYEACGGNDYDGASYWFPWFPLTLS